MDSSSFRKYFPILPGLITAVLYWVTGWMGLLVALPPGFATPVWLASGVAIACTLKWGPGVAPGIVLGSMLINAPNCIKGHALVPGLLVATVIGLGAASQALLAYRLTGFGRNKPTTFFDFMGQIFKVGPLACLVSSTVGVGTLWASGRIDATMLAPSWGTWWFGDTMGVLFFAPIIHCLLHQHGLRLAIGVAAFAISATLISWRYSVQQIYARQEVQFEALVEQQMEAIEARVEHISNGLNACASFLESTPNVNRTNWRSFVAGLNPKNNYPEVLGFGVIQKISRSQADAYTNLLRNDDAPNFKIRTSGNLPDMFIISYIEPIERNAPALGYDIGTESLRREAAEWSMASGRMAISTPVKLIQSTKDEKGFLLLNPVQHRSPMDHSKVSIQEEWVYCPIMIHDLFAISRRHHLTTTSICVYDGPATSDHMLFTSQDSEHQHRDLQNPLKAERSVTVGGRQWTICIATLPNFFETISSIASRIVLVSGLFFSLLLSWLVFVLASTRQKALKIANQMTQGLKETERVLWQKTSVLETLHDHAPLGMFHADASGRCTYANRKMEVLTGYNSEEILGEGWKKVIHPQDAPMVFREWEIAAIQGSMFVKQFRYQRADGGSIWVSVLASPIRKDNEVMGFVGTVEDITQRHAFEEALNRKQVELECNVTQLEEARQSSDEQAKTLVVQATELMAARDAAEAANRTKGEFLATMSHEIRTPLNGVIGMVQLLMATEQSREQREYSQTIRHSAEALMEIINDILDLSKMEAGKIEVEQVAMRPRTTVEEAISLVSERAAEKNLDLVCLVEPNTPEAIMGDPARLRQILLNLLSNGIKFTERGEVVVKVSGAKENTLDDVLRIEVSDTGVGIPMDRQDRLFQPFSQADSSTTRKFGGTGLGLVICKKLATMMGGEIRFASQPGVGTTFYLSLPAKPATETGFKRSPEPLQGRVLLIEDHPLQLEASVLNLTALGLDSIRANSSEAALAALDKVPADLLTHIILDSSLPNEDCIAFGRKLRKHPNAQKAQLILAAPMANRAAIMKNAGNTFHACLAKPLLYNRLNDCFHALSNHTERPAEESQRSDLPKARILLVEDNKVNQTVARKMLLAIGCIVDVVNNGAEAVHSCVELDYDLIFMDCQMPVMDGFEATIEIRKLPEPKCRIPIVALTASVLSNAREQCLGAGMDDYLCKPIRKEELEDAICKWVRFKPEAEQTPQTVAAIQTQGLDTSRLLKLSVLDQARLTDLKGIFQGDSEIELIQLVEGFLKDAYESVAVLPKLLGEREIDQIQKLAHKLKGSSGNLAANRFSNLAVEIDRAAKEKNLTDLGTLVPLMDQELHVLEDAFHAQKLCSGATAT